MQTPDGWFRRHDEYDAPPEVEERVAREFEEMRSAPGAPDTKSPAP